MRKMLWTIIDLVATNYGWAVIDGMFLDEAVEVLPLIQSRKRHEYRMQLLLFHTQKPEETLKELERMDMAQEEKKSTFDDVGYEILKQRLTKRGLIQVK